MFLTKKIDITFWLKRFLWFLFLNQPHREKQKKYDLTEKR
jgi:hypothetical protein